MYFDVELLYKKLKRHYDMGDVFRAFMLEEKLFPVTIKLKRLQQKDIQNSFLQIRNEIKKLQKEPFEITFGEFEFKTIGRQNIPTEIKVNTLYDYLMMIDKKREYDEFVELYEKIVLKFANLKELFVKKPFVVLEYKDVWDRLLSVVDYLVLNREPKIYTREITLEMIDTKFIQKYQKIIDVCLSYILETKPLNSLANFAFEKRYNLKYPLPQIRFRILDRSLYIQNLSDITLCVDEFESLYMKCKNVFIVENKITTLSFLDIKDSIVIFGSGYGVSVLKNIKCLNDKNIYYWGDMDLDGYAILSQLRGYFPHTKSLMMDMVTFKRFENVAVKYTNQKGSKDLQNLIQSERDVYNVLSSNLYDENIRIEQEKIPYSYVRGVLSRFQ